MHGNGSEERHIYIYIYIYNKCDHHIKFSFYITTYTSIQNILLNITDISQKKSHKCVEVGKVCTIIFVDIYYKLFNLWCYLLKAYSDRALVVHSPF